MVVFQAAVGWYVKPASMCHESPGPGSCGALQTGGGVKGLPLASLSLHLPAAMASACAKAVGLTRGNFEPAPKSKPREPKNLPTNRLKLSFLLGADPINVYMPFVVVDRSLSFPASLQVFLTTQSEPGCRVAPNSLSNTRSYPLSTPIPRYDCFTKLNIIWDSLFICCELPCQSKFASKSV